VAVVGVDRLGLGGRFLFCGVGRGGWCLWLSPVGVFVWCVELVYFVL